MEFLVLTFFNGCRSVGLWSVHLVGGWLFGGQWPVVGWSVGSLLVVGGPLIGGFKETHRLCDNSRRIQLVR